MEPYVQLAFALRATPGGYAVLLGAGASISAGMPSAWDVQQDLIERLASAEGATEIGDPHAWYEERFGHPATYDSLLAALTSTPYERQALLRSYFEPNEQDREEGRKQPTAAHRAIARLVAAGHVRIVLTTNFDRLMESALREAGVEPTVVAHPDDAVGLAPPHTLNCLVVHVHGDYLNPTSMLNTPEELDRYTPKVDALLDRVFADYGLVVTGWSATWDPALRNALARSTDRVFASYWTDPKELSTHAQDLLAHRRATYVQAEADTFFGQVADAVDALVDTERRHPASIAIAVASAKRALSGTQQAITLHDTLRREFSRIATLPVHTTGPWRVPDAEAEHQRRLKVLEAESELLLSLVATAAYWGGETTDRWWMRDIEQLGKSVDGDGDEALLLLARASATTVIYAAGVAALAAERWHTLVRVLTEPQAHSPVSGEPGPAALLLGPRRTLGRQAGAEHLHGQLRPVFTEHLALSEAAYADAWERFDHLRTVAQLDAHLGFDAPRMRRTELRNAHQTPPEVWLDQAIQRHKRDEQSYRTPTGIVARLFAAGYLDAKIDRLSWMNEQATHHFKVNR
ncbi:SIR2 family protein [Streptomyces sp. NPDC002787]